MNNQAFTGITRRLNENEIEVEISTTKPPKYIVDSDGDRWILLRPATGNGHNVRESNANERASVPGIGIQTTTTGALEHIRDTPTTIPLRGYPRNYITYQPYTQYNSVTDTLMPIIGVLCVVLAVVAIGGYTIASDLPLGLIIPLALMALFLYARYRYSPAYERNGRAFESFMRQTHKPNGRIDKQAMVNMLRRK